MRQAFTIVELVFIIIILGILAATAIQRLAITRDDAEIAKIGLNLNRIINDFRAFYTSQGEFKNLSAMTFVQFSGNGSGVSDSITAAGTKCIKLTLVPVQNDGKPAFLKIESENTSIPICQKVANDKTIKNLLNNQFNYTKKSTGSIESSGIGEIEISGIDSKI